MCSANQHSSAHSPAPQEFGLSRRFFFFFPPWQVNNKCSLGGEGARLSLIWGWFIQHFIYETDINRKVVTWCLTTHVEIYSPRSVDNNSQKQMTRHETQLLIIIHTNTQTTGHPVTSDYVITSDEKHDNVEVVSSAGSARPTQFISRGLLLHKYNTWVRIEFFQECNPAALRGHPRGVLWWISHMAPVRTLTSQDRRFSSPCWACPSRPPSAPTLASPPRLWTSRTPPCCGPLPAPGASDGRWYPYTFGSLLPCFESADKRGADAITEEY